MKKDDVQSYDLNDPALVSIIDELPLWSAPFGLKMLDTVIMKPKMNVLDIGCGTGFPLIELANRLGTSCQVYGIDPWGGALERIQTKIKVQNLMNVNVIEGKAENLPFGENLFHLIVSNNGINNVDNPEAVLAECARVSRVRAQMIITVNLPGTMKEFYSVFEKILRGQGKTKEISKITDHILAKRKPLDVTLSMIKKSGFKIVRVIEDSFNLRYLDGGALLNHFFIKLAFLDSWKEILLPEDVPAFFSMIEKKLNQLAEQQGGIRLTIPYVCLDCQK